jgi:hypothetical protein
MATSWASRRGNFDYYWDGDIPRVLRAAQHIISSRSTHCSGAAALSNSGKSVPPTSTSAVRWSANGAIAKSVSDLRLNPYLEQEAIGNLWDAASRLGFGNTTDIEVWTFDQSHQALAWALEKTNWVTNAQVLRRARRLLLECPHHVALLANCSRKCRLRIDTRHDDEMLQFNLFSISTSQLGGEMDDCNSAENALQPILRSAGYRDFWEVFNRGTAEQIIELLDWAIAEQEYGPTRYHSTADKFKH